MRKYKIKLEVAEKLLQKLIKDTKSGRLEWERCEMNTNVEKPAKFAVPLTSAGQDYCFCAKLNEESTWYFQHDTGHYYVWMEQGNEIAQFENELYHYQGIVNWMVDLDKEIRKGSDFFVKDAIKAYLDEEE